MRKIKKTIYIAIFVSLAAQIRFNFLTDGFIIAMSVLVMAIFIYCYEDLSARYVAFCSGIFSPLVRLLIQVLEGEALSEAAALVVPDMTFFFAYGLFYPLIYKYIIRAPKSIRNFAYVALACDFLSNMMELAVRSVQQGASLITPENVVYLFLIALCRTVLVQTILLAMETYSNLLVDEEHDREYRRLIVQESIFENELYVMDKNAAEIETLMKQAFYLYKAMERLDADEELKSCALDISKNAHEIKGDYLGIVDVLKDTFINHADEGSLNIRDIVHIEKGNLQSVFKRREYKVEIVTRIRVEFQVREYFKMMSVVRNLVLNAAEAIAPAEGRVTVTVKEEGEAYLLLVRDNGPGIRGEDMETIFFDGYSTKFDARTGNVQRGVGLTVVKDYVENYFHGSIRVESEVGRFTQFTLTMPKDAFEERGDGK